MSETKLPGIKAVHRIITPDCRIFARPEIHPDPRIAAFGSAMRDLGREYEAICDARGDDFTAHLVLTIEAAPPPGDGDGE